MLESAPRPPRRWLSPTTSGRVTILIGVACVLALLVQGAVRDHVPGAAVALVGLVLAVLVLLDGQVAHRYGERPPRHLALAMVLLHALLVEALTLLDGLTYTAIMYLTLPFPAFFLVGKRAGLLVSAALLAWFTLKFMLVKPGWIGDPALTTSYLLFVLALILLVMMAQVVQRERVSRQQAEQLLRDLETAHRQLAESHTHLLRSAEQMTELATIAERNRLARDIHDSLGHALTVIGVQLEKALIVADDDPAGMRTAVGHAKRLADQALTDVRQSVSTLRQEQAPFVLRMALERLVADLHGMPFQIHLAWTGDEQRFSKQQLLALYRAAQEGLTNVQKHAHAQQVQITLDLGERSAVLVLEDDGIGVSDDPLAGKGFGLRGVQERLELISGRLAVRRKAGRGTRLTVTVPRSSVGSG